METVFVLGGSALIVACFGIMGGFRGFARMIFSFASLFITVFLVWQIYPHVDTFIRTNTGVYDTVREKSVEYIVDELEKKIKEQGAAGPSTAKEAGEELLNQSWLSVIRDFSEGTGDRINEAGKGTIATVADNIGSMLARFIIKLLAFIIAFAVIRILLQVVYVLLAVVTRIPVIHTLNKTAGVLLGLVEGLVIVWILMIVAIIFFNTTIGAAVLRAVNENSIFAAVYKANPLLWLLTKS